MVLVKFFQNLKRQNPQILNMNVLVKVWAQLPRLLIVLQLVFKFHQLDLWLAFGELLAQDLQLAFSLDKFLELFQYFHFA